MHNLFSFSRTYLSNFLYFFKGGCTLINIFLLTDCISYIYGSTHLPLRHPPHTDFPPSLLQTKCTTQSNCKPFYPLGLTQILDVAEGNIMPLCGKFCYMGQVFVVELAPSHANKITL